MEFLFAWLLVAASVSASPLTNQRSTSDVNLIDNSLSSTPESDTLRGVNSSPAYVFVGEPEKLLRCLQEDPTDCEVWYEGSSSTPGSLLVAGEYIYAGLYSGNILRCELYQKKCEIFHAAGHAVEALAVTNEYLFAGLYNINGYGSIVRCLLHERHNCRVFQNLNSEVFSLNHYYDDKIVAGLKDGSIFRCSIDEEDSCVLIDQKTSAIMGIATVGNNVTALTYNGLFYSCSRFDFEAINCEYKTTDIKLTRDLTLYNGALYIPEEKKKVSVCKLTDITDCSEYGKFKKPWSIAFAYAVNHIQKQYNNENKLCTWQSASMCPPFVTYYDAQERTAFEVHVKEGKLYNARGLLVDTADASEGYSGPAAIFVMSPDGTILLSNRHVRELLHTSSLLAGGPASGAGEMVVNKGKIVKITTCSAHYLPDLNLNRQVVESLKLKGYADSIELELCEDTATNQPILNEEIF